MLFDKIGITKRQTKSLLGAILIKFATAVIQTWGNINLYFLSAFHYQGTNITPQTNSVILFLSVPFMLGALLAANKLCSRFGMEKVVRAGCLMFVLSPITTLLSFNLYIFSLFSILIPGMMFSLITVPVLNCIWSQFPNSKNKTTSILVIAFGVGGILWNYLAMKMVNPNNQTTYIYPTNSGDMSLFRQQVSKNVQRTAVLGFLVTGSLAVIGSFLLQKNYQVSDQALDKQNQAKQQKKQDEFISQKKTRSIQDQQDPRLSTNVNQYKQQSASVEKNKQILAGSDQSIQKLKPKKQKQVLYKQAIKDQRFIIIIIISILTGLYEIYLMMNFKIIFMPIIGDDHFLSYASMVCSCFSIGGAFFWGCLGDWKGVYFTILLLSFLDFGCKIFSDFATNKVTILIMVALIGLISKAMTTITGPGFVQIFGLKVGTQLLPLKGVAIMSGYVLVPVFQIITAKFLNPHQYLICISSLSLITLLCAIRLKFLNHVEIQTTHTGSAGRMEIMNDKNMEEQLNQQQA